MEITEGEGVDFVIDAVGRPEVLQDGHAALAKCGTLLTLGGIAKPAGLPINLHLLKGATYRGSHQGDAVSRTVSFAAFSRLFLRSLAISSSLFLRVSLEGIGGEWERGVDVDADACVDVGVVC